MNKTATPQVMERLARVRARLAARQARLDDEIAAARERTRGPVTPGHDLTRSETLNLPRAWHVGHLDPAGKKTWSLEGRGLSISVHPDDWAGIAQLAGDTWQFDRPAGHFLNAHEITPEHRAAITDWAVTEGLVEVRTVWAAPYYDSEEDTERESVHATYEDALAESGEDENGDPVEPQERTRMVATADLARQDLTCREGDIDPDGQILGLYAQHGPHGLDLDGVWWEDSYDPAALSAPRGVIAPEKFARWKHTKDL